jgi:hypothetical protein
MIDKKLNSLVAASAVAVVIGFVASADAAITFLDHFNGQTNFSLNPSQGDYAAGSGTAVVSSSAPGTGAGYFGGGDLAYHTTTNGRYVQFEAKDNVQYTSTTSGGFTVGAWVKMAGTALAGDVLRVGSQYTWYDHVDLTYGWSSEHELRVNVQDYEQLPGYSAQSSSQLIDVSEWVYLAASVDLTNNQIVLYDFDKNGVAGTNSGTAYAIPFDPDLFVNGTLPTYVIQIGLNQYASTSDIWIDEVSVDDQVLSASEIQGRVSLMAAGNPLSVPEPASVTLIGLGGLLLKWRRRG